MIRNLPPNDSVFYLTLQSDQITYDEDTGKAVRKEEYNKESKQARRMLQRQHKRHNRPRKQVSLDEIMGDIGGTNG